MLYIYRVTTALASASKSRQLARRVFFSFTPSSRHVMLQQDIARFFPNQEQLASVYAIFDKDENGDVSLEEIEMACLDIHRERQSLASSMRDLDSAVARLDQIFVSLWYIVSILIIIGLVSISFSSFVTTGATFVLGLSWLIGGTSQEVLAAIIFLLAKHPFDVQDLIQIDGYEGTYVVKEIMLLSTIFKKTDGNVVQIPHTILNTKGKRVLGVCCIEWVDVLTLPPASFSHHQLQAIGCDERKRDMGCRVRYDLRED